LQYCSTQYQRPCSNRGSNRQFSQLPSFCHAERPLMSSPHVWVELRIVGATEGDATLSFQPLGIGVK
jgi:hypothetical protein